METKQTKKATSCGIIPIFVNEQGEKEFLLVLQNNGNWSFPKGHVEGDETFLETAKRELFEETGVVCDTLIPDTHFTLEYVIQRPDARIEKKNYYFIGFVEQKDGVRLQEEEIQDYCWCSAHEVLQKLQFENIRNLFQEVFVFLRKIKSIDYI